MRLQWIRRLVGEALKQREAPEGTGELRSDPPLDTSEIGQRSVERSNGATKTTAIDQIQAAKDRAYLHDSMKDDWRFFAEQVNASTGFFPFDNITTVGDRVVVEDIELAAGEAEIKAQRVEGTVVPGRPRTSTTNIGGYLLSVMAAEKEKWIDRDEAVKLLRSSVDAYLALEKYQGKVVGLDGNTYDVEQPYNWYARDKKGRWQIEDGRKKISIVDNGNLALFMMGVVAALKDPARGALSSAEKKLIEDLNGIVAKMRFDIAYNPDRRQLASVVEIDENNHRHPSDQTYDMVISEGRNPYLVAIRMGQIPASTWTNLAAKYDRPGLNVVRAYDFQSWTGTIFESRTTSLLLNQAGTPLEKADRQCVDAHLQEGIRIGGKWYAFKSEALSKTEEGYGAFGSAKFAQHNKFTEKVKGADYLKYEVFSPHAAAMAIGVAPEEALSTLRNMESIPSPDGKTIHMRGRYGFKESFTLQRDEAGELQTILPTDEVFSHHKAWELISKHNYLSDSWLVKRFHAEYDQDGLITGLLKTPATKYGQSPALKPSQLGVRDTYQAPSELEVHYPKNRIVGAGKVASLATPNGATTVLDGNLFVSHGESFWLRDNKTGSLVPFELESVQELRKGKYYYDVRTASGQKLGVTVTQSSSATDPLKFTTYDIRNGSDQAVDLSLYTGFHLAMARKINDYMEHRPHQSLRVVTEHDRDARTIIARRTDEPQDQASHPWGFATLQTEDGKGPDLGNTSGRSVFGRFGGPKIPKAVADGQTGWDRNNFGVVEEPVALLGKRFQIPAGEKVSATLVLGATGTKAEIATLVKQTPPTSLEAGTPQFPSDEVFGHMTELKREYDRAERMQTKPSRAKEIPPSELYQFTEGGRVLSYDPFGTPKEWALPLANEAGHCAVWTGDGGGYSAGRAVMDPAEGSTAVFGANAQRNRITPWGQLGRGVLVTEGGETWSIAASPAPLDDGKYRVEEGPGTIKYLFEGRGLAITMTVSCGADDPLELWKIDVTNKRPQSGGDGHPEQAALEISSFLKFALGERFPRDEVETEIGYDPNQRALFAHNPKSIFPSARTFHGVIGGDGIRRNSLFGKDNDPFSGLSTRLLVSPGESKSLSFVLGQGRDEAEAKALVAKFKKPGQVAADLKKSHDKMEAQLNNLQVHTPDPAFDSMLNTWLPYQAYYAHYLARTGLKQSGGAIGGRDQLQTVRGLLATGNPFFDQLARSFIIESCRHQFESGRAQTWYHPHDNYGQESIISDTALWLPFAIDEYIKATGDRSILQEKAAFSINTEELGTRRDVSMPMGFTTQVETVFEHGRRALEAMLKATKALKEQGGRGIPPYGGGDWNDGISRAGHLGKGESVWNGQFLYDLLGRYASLAEGSGEPKAREIATQFRGAAKELKTAINEQAWKPKEGFYHWGWDDAGDPLGPIYALTQAWAVRAGIADDAQAVRAMATAIRALYQKDKRIILLFDRALDKADTIGGKLYADPTGIRENGAQYTHGVTWLVEQVFEMGLGDLGYELLQCLLPTAHAADPKTGRHYGNEPNAVTADIYGGDPKSAGVDTAGKGGWSWYTGSASWVYSLSVQSMLGIRRDGGDALAINPSIPHEWNGYNYEYRHGASVYKVEVDNPDHVCKGVKKIEVVDDQGRVIQTIGERSNERVRLVDDGRAYRVRVTMGFVEGETNKAVTVGLAEALKGTDLPVAHHLPQSLRR